MPRYPNCAHRMSTTIAGQPLCLNKEGHGHFPNACTETIVDSDTKTTSEWWFCSKRCYDLYSYSTNAGFCNYASTEKAMFWEKFVNRRCTVKSPSATRVSHTASKKINTNKKNTNISHNWRASNTSNVENRPHVQYASPTGSQSSQLNKSRSSSISSVLSSTSTSSAPANSTKRSSHRAWQPNRKVTL